VFGFRRPAVLRGADAKRPDDLLGDVANRQLSHRGLRAFIVGNGSNECNTLYRIEHMQAMILARDEKTRRKALQKLLPMQRREFAGLFEVMDGLPVVIRTLDPPLHEFLPKRENLMVDLAVLPFADIKRRRELAARYQKFGAEVKNLKTVVGELLKRVEEPHEFNPMLGLRGCRLGIMYPEITEMQVRAIFEAVVQVAKKIFANDPFAVLDQEGVGQLVKMAVERGRKTRPDLEIGVCGEHGGEPSSVQFCYRVGMNYVSCSPYRVPIARLAAAQAAISGDKSETQRTA